jgi:4-amino-4-deoxy-L-arabinose transferase-like glycosyltransferase
MLYRRHDRVPDVSSPAPEIAWRPLAAVTGVLVVVLVALSGRYGYFRDELYFLACGRHLAWGYPDQPPGTPFLALVMNGIGRGSLYVFRLPATAAAAGVTLLTGLMAREFGGGRFAQVLAAVTAAGSTYVLLSGHLLITSTIDLIVWVLLTWLVIRILRTGDQRLWLVAGVVAGLGLLNKDLPIVLLVGFLVGFLVTPSARPLLRSPWLWAGAAVAAIAWAPGLIWQAQHGWPQLTLAGQIRDEYGTPGQRAQFVVFQLVLFSLGATYLWIIGLRQLWRTQRALAWTWLFVLAFFIVTAGQVYYAAGTYPMLIAAGAVVVEQRRRRWTVVVAVLASSALTLPAALPILSPAALASSPWNGLGETQRETVGWPQLVDVVAAAYRTIPKERRAESGIYATNYGEAGAIDRFGAARGLPHAWSGLNGYGLWGPPPHNMAPVVVIWEDGPPSEFFSDCSEYAKITAPVSNEESDRAAVYVCGAPIGGWALAWPRLVHLSN